MSPPPVIVTPERVDFGRVAEGAVVEKTVRIRNTGEIPLVVERVHSSCGCTTTQAPTTIPPGTDAPLTVRFNSRDRVGDIHQQVSLSFAGGPAKAIPLTVETTGNVTREVALSAKSLDLGEQETKTASLTLTRLDKQPLVVSPQQVSTSLHVAVTPNGSASANVSVTRSGSRVAGAHEEEVTLGLNHPLLPTVTVPVRWTNNSAYHVTPSTLNFGSVAPAASLSKTVRLSTTSFDFPTSGFRVLSAPPGWQAHVYPALAQRAAVVSLRGSLRKEKLLHSRLVLATGNPREPQIIIPVYAVADTGAGSDVCTGDDPAKTGSR